MNKRNSWQLGTVAGIDIFVHWTFLILPAWIAFSTLAAGGGLFGAAHAVLFVCVLFGCVLLHELGHALMARHYNVGTRDITLLPIGGLARLDRIPRRPVEELAVALAGPAVNVVIAIALLGVLILAGTTGFLFTHPMVTGHFLANLMWANVALVVFNLLPAFPMDGGRVFRALLSTQLPRVKATRIASSVGQVLAIGLAVLGLFSNWMLMFVALFIFIAARNETEMVEQEEMMGIVPEPVRMSQQVCFVPANVTLSQIASQVCFAQQEDFPVVQNDTVVGMLSKKQVLKALAAGDGHHRVADVMRWSEVYGLWSIGHVVSEE